MARGTQWTGARRVKVDRRAEALEKLYAELPSVDCQELCGDCCSFIGMTRLEQRRITQVGGPEIKIWQMPCPALSIMGRCTVYTRRPMICRLYGVVEDLRCPYGCEPERMLTREEGREFLARVQAIAGEDWIENDTHKR